MEKTILIFSKSYGIKKYLFLFFTYKYLKNKNKFSFKFIENSKFYKNFDLLGGLFFDFEDKKKMFGKIFIPMEL